MRLTIPRGHAVLFLLVVTLAAGASGNIAGNLVLADQAGLQSRVWGLKGHVVPEIYFEGGWRVLDPDEEVYDFEDDGKTLKTAGRQLRRRA